jgi:hypothetical protein
MAVRLNAFNGTRALRPHPSILSVSSSFKYSAGLFNYLSNKGECDPSPYAMGYKLQSFGSGAPAGMLVECNGAKMGFYRGAYGSWTNVCSTGANIGYFSSYEYTILSSPNSIAIFVDVWKMFRDGVAVSSVNVDISFGVAEILNHMMKWGIGPNNQVIDLATNGFSLYNQSPPSSCTHTSNKKTQTIYDDGTTSAFA